MPLTLTYTSEYGTITDAYHILKFFTIVSGSSPNCTVSGSAWLNKATYDELNTPNGKLMSTAKTAGAQSTIVIETGNTVVPGTDPPQTDISMPNGGYISIEQIPENEDGSYPDSQVKLEVTTEITGNVIDRCSIQPSNDGRSILIRVGPDIIMEEGNNNILVTWVNGLAANTARVRGVGIKRFIYT